MGFSALDCALQDNIQYVPVSIEWNGKSVQLAEILGERFAGGTLEMGKAGDTIQAPTVIKWRFGTS